MLRHPMLLPAALALALSACATQQEVIFDSNPQGAIVHVDDGVLGTTPFKRVMEKGDPVNFTLNKPGYKPYSFVGRRSYDPDSYLIDLELDPAASPAQAAATPAASPIRQYVLDSYLPLSENIVSGDGPYLKTLLQMAQVQGRDRAQALVQLRALHERQPYIIDFADGVVAALKPVMNGAADMPMPTAPTSGLITAPYQGGSAVVSEVQKPIAVSAPPTEILEVTVDSPIYTQPDLKAPTVAYAPAGRRVQLYEITANEQGKWARILDKRKTGWIQLPAAAQQ